MKYCVAIRTLGTAGDKYQILLDSLNRQTIKPQKIFVYIPYGYELPKETIGWEEYVRCPKGMITQRSLSFEEIDTEYILFCDDDLWLADDFVEKLYQGFVENNGDCIAPDVFKVQELSFIGKLKKAIAGYAFPRRDDGWAFKVMRNASYTYNMHPSKTVLPSESAAGACVLIKKDAYQSIHFEDERWMEDFGYPLGEDLLFFNKLHLMGYVVLIHYDTEIKHLDAGAGHSTYSRERVIKEIALSYAVSYRIKCNLHNNTQWEKFLCHLSYYARFLEQWVFTFVKELLSNHRIVFSAYPKGLWCGFRYVRSERYRLIPAFDAYIDN